MYRLCKKGYAGIPIATKASSTTDLMTEALCPVLSKHGAFFLVMFSIPRVDAKGLAALQQCRQVLATNDRELAGVLRQVDRHHGASLAGSMRIIEC